MNVTETKKCTTCKTNRPLDYFYRLPAAPDGLTYKCRICFSEYQRERRKAHPHVRQADRECAESYRLKHRNRATAKKRVHDALAKGILKPEPCGFCGNPQTETHHESYERQHWLAVLWLCRLCHRRRHTLHRPYVEWCERAFSEMLKAMPEQLDAFGQLEAAE